MRRFRPLRGLSLRSKVFFLFAGAALLIVVPALWLIASSVEERAYARATEDLDDAALSLQNSWSYRGDNLVQAAQLLATNPDVVDAWTRRHVRALRGSLREGLDKEVVIATDSAGDPLFAERRVTGATLAAAAGQGTMVALSDSGPLRLAVVRVKRDTARFAQAGKDSAKLEVGRDTVTLGFLGIGTPLSAAGIKKDFGTSGTEVALLVGDSLIGTTLPRTVAAETRELLGGRRPAKQVYRFGGEDYRARSYPLEAGGADVTVVLFRRVTMELRIVQGIQSAIVGIGFFALIIALILAAVVARIVARPTQALAEASVRLARGDYAAPLPRDSGDEIGQLARAFGEMRAAIGEREQRLRSAQAEMIHREKLAAMGRLVAQLSHEINNPIYNIQNCLEALERRGNPSDPNREFLTLAQEELARMATLTRQLLDQSRPLSDAAQPMSLNGMVQRVLTLAAPQLSEHGVRIATQLDPRLPEVVVHPDGVQQVLANLVENAGDAMPEGGTLTVTTREDGEAVEVVVEDTGTGIAELDLPHIFEAFYTTKPGVAGIGLGLFVSEGIIRGHRGRLSVESTVGKGSRFTVRLPRETMDEAMHEPVPGGEPVGEAVAA
ncbi:MAG: HAMP domain-containing protein [Gemmatimonadetes bacterium]|nr:HAMP domain-containing protein [Gemmatimonadota bacterium]